MKHLLFPALAGILLAPPGACGQFRLREGHAGR